MESTVCADHKYSVEKKVGGKAQTKLMKLKKKFAFNSAESFKVPRTALCQVDRNFQGGWIFGNSRSLHSVSSQLLHLCPTDRIEKKSSKCEDWSALKNLCASCCCGRVPLVVTLGN